MDQDRLPELIVDLYRIVSELETMFLGRRFTPDGHLVGSLGECLAAYHYGLELLTASSPGVDATKDGINIEIKVTQGKRVALRSGPEHLLVLKLDRQGGFSEVYNGPGTLVWRELEHKPRPSNGQCQLSLTRLHEITENVGEHSRLSLVIPTKASTRNTFPQMGMCKDD